MHDSITKAKAVATSGKVAIRSSSTPNFCMEWVGNHLSIATCNCSSQLNLATVWQ